MAAPTLFFVFTDAAADGPGPLLGTSSREGGRGRLQDRDEKRYFAPSAMTSSKLTAMSCLVGTHSTFLKRAATVMGM